MEKLRSALEEVELLGGDVVVARERSVECDRERQSLREGLTVMRKGGAEPGKPSREVAEDAREWVMRPGGFFVRLPHKNAVHALEQDQKRLDAEIRALEKRVKDKTRRLGEVGAMNDHVGPGMLGAFLNLQDNK